VTVARVDLAGKLSDARARVEAETADEDRGLAKYARLERKEARIRTDQDAALSALTKKLMRRRTVKAERITDNTLIRVAIDLLLAHADELRGSTEDELRNSVASAHSQIGTPGVRESVIAGVASSGWSGVPASATPGLSHFRTSEGRNSGTPDVRNSVRPDVWNAGTSAVGGLSR